MSFLENSVLAGTVIANRDSLVASIGSFPAFLALGGAWIAVQSGANALKRPLGLYREAPGVSEFSRFLAGSPFFMMVGVLVGLLAAAVQGGVASRWTLALSDLLMVLALVGMLAPSLLAKTMDEPVSKTLTRTSLNIIAGLFAYAVALDLGDAIGYGIGVAVTAVITAVGIAVAWVESLLAAVAQIVIFLLIGYAVLSGGGGGGSISFNSPSRERDLTPAEKGWFGYDDYGHAHQSDWARHTYEEDKRQKQEDLNRYLRGEE